MVLLKKFWWSRVKSINFILLNKLLLILILLTGLNLSASAQQKPASQEQTQVKLMNFYPNPASNVISFDFIKGYNAAYTLRIYNFIGRPVREISKLNVRNTINLGDFYRGIYIFKLTDRNGALVESGKFQVVK